MSKTSKTLHEILFEYRKAWNNEDYEDVAKSEQQILDWHTQELKKIPDLVKGIMVSGIPTLHKDMDTISLQDLRLLIEKYLKDK